MNSILEVPLQELDLLEAYLHGEDVNHQAFFKERQIPDLDYPSQIEIAVAQIVLYRIQGRLPQWLCTDERGFNVTGRTASQRPSKVDFLRLKPELLFCVNWADSAPGICWPEAYYVTHIPGLDQYIVTASRDSTDLFGCTDHTLGFAPASRPRLEACRAIVVEYWQQQFACGERWERLFDEGVVDIAIAERWAEDVKWETANE
jgi:hypothetical protein